MQQIASALEGLRDEQARLRVMRWAMERFFPAFAAQTLERAGSAADTTTASEMDAEDTTLEVAGLDELFMEDTLHPRVETHQHRVDLHQHRVDLHRPAVGREPIESMVKGFVADFQRVANEWQGA